MQYDSQTEHFSLSRFLMVNIGTLAGIFALLKVMFPAIWDHQISIPLCTVLGTFIFAHLVNAFVEYFFHRYVLHAQVIPFFKHFYVAHNHHHDLTDVKQVVVTSNKFPIVEEPQHESSFFPWWSLLVFSIFLTPFYIALWFIYPSLPIFIAGYTALFWSMLLYELFHAAWHWPITTWTLLFSRRYTGRFWHLVYTFHLRHHANVSCNESVSGFFGIPLPDIIFGTYLKSQTRFPDQTFVPIEEYRSPRPYLFIRLLDRFLIGKVK
jgi:hemolysin III